MLLGLVSLAPTSHKNHWLHHLVFQFLPPVTLPQAPQSCAEAHQHLLELTLHDLEGGGGFPGRSVICISYYFLWSGFLHGRNTLSFQILFYLLLIHGIHRNAPPQLLELCNDKAGFISQWANPGQRPQRGGRRETWFQTLKHSGMSVCHRQQALTQHSLHPLQMLMRCQNHPKLEKMKPQPTKQQQNTLKLNCTGASGAPGGNLCFSYLFAMSLFFARNL